MVARIDAKEVARRLEALRQAKEAGRPKSHAAQALGMSESRLNNWLRDFENGGKKYYPQQAIAMPEKPVVAPPELSPRETRDATFYRKRTKDLEARLEKVEHLAEELAGLHAAVDPAPPEWTNEVLSKGSRSVLILNTSDLHFGEVIQPGEINGINAYNPEIAQERMRKLFNAACTIGPRWIHDGVYEGVLLTLNGDLTSGDIHEELMRTNALTSHQQVEGVIGIYDAGIRQLLEQYGKVHVAVTPGNHGRTTLKNSFKLHGALSYDTLVGSMLRDRFRDEPRVTFAIAAGFDVRVPLYGKTIVCTHGHMMGTGGGQGFAGPVLPIIRGGHKMRLQSYSAQLGCDLVLIGHYHTSAAPPGILANGSVVGYGEFANGIRAAVEPPKQWLARFSSSWGLCETLAVQLEEAPSRIRFKAA